MDKDTFTKAFSRVDHDAPLADITHLTEAEKEALKYKAFVKPGNYAYEVFDSDEEFEQVVACYAPVSYGENTTEEQMMDVAGWMRADYYRDKKYRILDKEVFEPLMSGITDYARTRDQDTHFVLYLEKKELECIDAYLSNYFRADANGNYSDSRWVRLCINLLELLVFPEKITDEMILRMNPRPMRPLLTEWEYNMYINDTDMNHKLFVGGEMYWHKAYGLCCRVRQQIYLSWRTGI